MIKVRPFKISGQIISIGEKEVEPGLVKIGAVEFGGIGLNNTLINQVGVIGNLFEFVESTEGQDGEYSFIEYRVGKRKDKIMNFLVAAKVGDIERVGMTEEWIDEFLWVISFMRKLAFLSFIIFLVIGLYTIDIYIGYIAILIGVASFIGFLTIPSKGSIRRKTRKAIKELGILPV